MTPRFVRRIRIFCRTLKWYIWLKGSWHALKHIAEFEELANILAEGKRKRLEL